MKNNILIGDALTWLKRLPDNSVHCVVTSPPYYGLRDYGVAGQVGLEDTPDAYIERMVTIFHEVRRVLRADGNLWLNLGDSYASKSTGSDTTQSTLGGGKFTQTIAGKRPDKLSLPEKNLMMMPARVAIALQSDGWYLRSDIIWHKPNPMPESVLDRPTKSHEHVFLLTKSAKYFYDADAIREPHISLADLRKRKIFTNKGDNGGAQLHLSRDRREYFHQSGRNKRDVWTIATAPYPGSHFAVMPPELAETAIKAGCPEGGIVLDPFGGAGTTAIAAIKNSRDYCLIELNVKYVGLAQQRIKAFDPYQEKVYEDGGTQLSLFAPV